MSIDLRVLKANSGDCIWIRFGNDNSKKNIIIDTGTKDYYTGFKRLLQKIENNNENVDLLILTHSDGDHIGGLSTWLKLNKGKNIILKKVWFNDGNEINRVVNKCRIENKDFSIQLDTINKSYTVGDGIKIIDYFKNEKIEVQSVISTGYEEIIGMAKLKVLSPTYKDLKELINNWELEDKNISYSGLSDNKSNLSDLMYKDKFEPDISPFNRASITFVFEYKHQEEEKRLVFLGDASAETIIEGKHKVYGKEPIEVSFIKLPHHGSSRNTNADLSKEFITDNFIVSTNGSRGNPSKKTIARLLNNDGNKGINLYSNYDWWTNKYKFTDDDYEKFINTGLLNRIKLESKLISLESGVKIGND